MFFDDQFRFDSSSSVVVPVAHTPNTKGTLSRMMANAVKANKSGFACIYFSNETEELLYFDNFMTSPEKSGHCKVENWAIIHNLKMKIAHEKVKIYRAANNIFALKQAETGIRVDEICRKMGVSEATYYNWKKKYGGLGISELRQLRQLQEENARLKQIVADLSLDKQMV